MTKRPTSLSHYDRVFRNVPRRRSLIGQRADPIRCLLDLRWALPAAQVQPIPIDRLCRQRRRVMRLADPPPLRSPPTKLTSASPGAADEWKGSFRRVAPIGGHSGESPLSEPTAVPSASRWEAGHGATSRMPTSASTAASKRRRARSGARDAITLPSAIPGNEPISSDASRERSTAPTAR